MIQLQETIYTKQSVQKVFAYVSDFHHIQEWDPGVVASEKTQPGRTCKGSEFSLVLKFGLFRPKMTYKIREYTPFDRVVLEGRGETFSAVDTIVFTPAGNGTRIDYRADLKFTGVMRYAQAWLTPLMRRIGKRALTGLQKKLDHPDYGPEAEKRPVSGSGWPDFLADRLVLPGMLMFSRLGYTLSRRFWSEPLGSLKGKQVVLTGGTSGIGKAAAGLLACHQANLTIIARNPKKAQQVQQEIIEKSGNPQVDFLIADLSRMGDIKRVTGRLADRLPCIDVLINNAGALFNERIETQEGIEQTFATDLLGVFDLTMRLKDLLSRSEGGRIINVSSGGMYTQRIDVDDLENKFEPYNGAKAYARAKRGLVILTRMWAEKFKTDGISVHAMHPGWVDTPGIERSLPVFHQRLKRIFRTPAQGADTIVWLAMSKRAVKQSGLFWLDRRPHETVVFPGTGETREERQALWDKLVRMSAAVY